MLDGTVGCSFGLCGTKILRRAVNGSLEIANISREYIDGANPILLLGLRELSSLLSNLWMRTLITIAGSDDRKKQ